MNLQRILIRVMLWMLAITAVAGVMTIFGSARVMGRVAGTGGLTAAAMLAAFPLSKFLDRNKKRLGGLVGLLGLVLAFMLALLAIWIGMFITTSDLQERLAASSFTIFVASMLAAFLLPARHSVNLSLAATTSLASESIVALLFLASIWWNFEERLAETAVGLLAAAAPAAMALIAPSARERAWRWIGPLAALVSFVMSFLGTWFIPSDDPTVYAGVLGIAFVVGYANVVLHLKLPDSALWLRLVAIAAAAATAGGITYISALSQGFKNSPPDMLARFTGACGIVTACATIALMVLLKLNPTRSDQAVTTIASVWLACPHCGKKFDARVGTSACPTCGLLFTIGVREPLCHVCQYPLLDLKGANCPECGTARSATLALAGDATEPNA
ncbi:MAG: zinc ribbon domain-containing protein [Phycisphaerales bacterium]|nr:zinc ribbon domain-containing protein [Phycisphaerales bacterium]